MLYSNVINIYMFIICMLILYGIIFDHILFDNLIFSFNYKKITKE